MVEVGGAGLKEDMSNSGLAVALVKARDRIGRDELKISWDSCMQRAHLWMES